PSTDVINDVRIVVQATGTPTNETYSVYLVPTPTPPAVPTPVCTFSNSVGFYDYTVLDCPIPSPTTGYTAVWVYMSHSNSNQVLSETGLAGIREVQVYKLISPGGLPVVTPTVTNTPTAVVTGPITQPAKQVSSAIGGFLRGLGLGPGDPPTPSAPAAGQP